MPHKEIVVLLGEKDRGWNLEMLEYLEVRGKFQEMRGSKRRESHLLINFTRILGWFLTYTGRGKIQPRGQKFGQRDQLLPVEFLKPNLHGFMVSFSIWLNARTKLNMQIGYRKELLEYETLELISYIMVKYWMPSP